MRTIPDVGVKMLPSIDSSVVLPLPEGPMRRVSSPQASDRLTPFKACTLPAPSPRNFTISTASITGAITP
jgi:hypothetical protein